MADMSDFEYARDRIMMGIERRKLSMSDRDRLLTAIHESGHAIVCYFTPGAKKLYKATIVARGSSLGATYMVPDESDMLSTTKEKVLANIDVAMGGHVAEKLFVGHEKVTTGCSSDLRGATNLAYEAVRRYGMFGEEAGYLSVDVKDVSQEHNAMIDEQVKKILDVRLRIAFYNFYIGIFRKSKGTSFEEGIRNKKSVQELILVRLPRSH
jgi:ATP-dependent Zn protease